MTQTIIILSILLAIYLIYKKYKKPKVKELSIIDEYKAAKKETDDFDAKYENDVAQSLEFDFEKYRDNIDGVDKSHWHISRMDSLEFLLVKVNQNGSVNIEVSYKREDDINEIIKTFKIKEVARNYSSEHKKFSSERMCKIIEKYFFLYKLKQEMERKDRKIKDVQLTLDIIGKSSSRNAKIDDILK